MTKQRQRQLYNIHSIDRTGEIEIIGRKYGSIYAHFTRALPEASKLLNAYIKTDDFEYLDDNHCFEFVVNRFPKKMTEIAVYKPTAIKDLDSFDQKFRPTRATFDVAINKEQLFQEIQNNIANGIEKMEISLGSSVTFNLEYQLQANTKKFIEDVADAHAQYETKYAVDASKVIELAKEVQAILTHAPKKHVDVELVENKHRYGTSYSARIADLDVKLCGSHGEDLKRKHPMIKVVTFNEVED